MGRFCLLSMLVVAVFSGCQSPRPQPFISDATPFLRAFRDGGPEERSRLACRAFGELAAKDDWFRTRFYNNIGSIWDPIMTLLPRRRLLFSDIKKWLGGPDHRRDFPESSFATYGVEFFWNFDVERKDKASCLVFTVSPEGLVQSIDYKSKPPFD